jgi:hypothetical protein
MNTHTDQELQAWMDDWQSERTTAGPPSTAEEIRNHVRRRHRQLIRWVAGEVAIGLGFLTFLLHRAVTQTDPVDKIAMGLLALVVATVMVFGAWNWRGAMSAAAETTSAYLAISVERLRRMRRSVTAGWAVLVFEVAVFTPWIWYQLHGAGASPTVDRAVFAWSLLALMVTLGVLFIIVIERWISDDESHLENLRRELSDDVNV